MKRFILKTILLLIPVIIGVAFSEIVPRRSDNDYKYKNNWLSENASSVQVLNLGSSHAYFGIDPTQFELMEFNGAHVSQDIHYDYFIFNKFVDKMKALEYLILPISYFTPTSNLEEGEEQWRVKSYCIYYHCPYHLFEPEYNLEIYNGIHPGVIIRTFLGWQSNRYCTDLGQGTQYKLEYRSENWKSSGATAAKRHTRNCINSERIEQNKQWVKEIIENCEKSGIKVILLTTPTYDTYREHLNPEQLEEMKKFCIDIQNSSRNVIYLNMLNDQRFIECDFYDADHLNEHGAIKLSKILNDYIMMDRISLNDKK